MAELMKLLALICPTHPDAESGKISAKRQGWTTGGWKPKNAPQAKSERKTLGIQSIGKQSSRRQSTRKRGER